MGLARAKLHAVLVSAPQLPGGIFRRKQPPAGGSGKPLRRGEAAQVAIDVADAFKPRDHLLADVAPLVVIDVREIESGLGRQRLLAELPAPARDARFDAEQLEQLGRKHRRVANSGQLLAGPHPEVKTLATKAARTHPRVAEASRLSSLTLSGETRLLLSSSRCSSVNSSVTSSSITSSAMI